jgi:predicted Mrr-cat superfamily restriction endonuclease
VNTTYPDDKPSTLANWTGQIEAFRFRMEVGDLVAMAQVHNIGRACIRRRD